MDNLVNKPLLIYRVEDVNSAVLINVLKIKLNLCKNL